MNTYRFVPGQRFTWKDRFFEIKLLIDANEIAIADLMTGVTTTVQRALLLEDFYLDQLQFAPTENNNEPQPEKPKQALDLSDYPEHLVEIARYRLSLIEEFLDDPVRGRRQRIEEKVALLRDRPSTHTGSPISTSSMYEWIKAYRQANRDIRALIPATERRGGVGQSRLEVDVEIITLEVIQEKYLSVRERSSIDRILLEINQRIREANLLRASDNQLNEVSRSTLVRRLEALNLKDRFLAKNGVTATRRQFRQYGTSEPITRLLQRVEIDHTRIDLMVAEEGSGNPLGRLTLTLMIDCASRYPMGYYLGFDPPSYVAVLECLYCAIQNKYRFQERFGTQHRWLAYGIPEMLVTDNGREFETVRDACAMLGIRLEKAPVRSPEYKGTIERMFGSLNALFHALPGTTFSNIFRRGDYKSMKQACLTLDEVERILNMYLVDLYAEDFHEGLQAIPAREWERLAPTFSPALPASERDLLIALGRTDERVVHHYGIEFQGLYYNSPMLGLLRNDLKGQKVKVKYHPADLGRLFIFDPFEQQYHEIPAVEQDYAAGLSLWKHRLVSNFARQNADRVNTESLAKSQREIDAIVDHAKQRAKKTTTQAKIERYKRSGETHSLKENKRHSPTTPALPEPASEQWANLEELLQNIDTENAPGWTTGFDLPATGPRSNKE